MSELAGARLGVLTAAVVLAMAAASLNAMDDAVPGGSDQLPHAEPTSLCSAYPNKSAAPVDAVLGEPVTVTTHVSVQCGGPVNSDHMALVLDGSQSMTRQSSREMKAAAEFLIESLDLANRRAMRIGVIEFGATTRVLCGMTDDEGRLFGCVNRVDRKGDAPMGAGIFEATKMLTAARIQADPDYLTEVIIVISGGHVTEACDTAVEAMRQALRNGILVITLCAGRDCDEECMGRVATSTRYYYRSGQHEDLGERLFWIFHREIFPRARSMLVHDYLSDLVVYEPESAAPPASMPITESRRLAWEADYIPADGITFAHRVISVATGEIPTSNEASGTMTDSMGRSVEFSFDIPIITVREPTATVTASPTATVTPSPTTTPTPTPVPVWMPLAVRADSAGVAGCQPGH